VDGRHVRLGDGRCLFDHGLLISTIRAWATIRQTSATKEIGRQVINVARLPALHDRLEG
jgi:hypothetical protein